MLTDPDLIVFIRETILEHPMRLLSVVAMEAAALFDLCDDAGDEPSWLEPLVLQTAVWIQLERI